MGLLDEQCSASKKNMGVVRCGELPSLPKMIITTPDDFFLDDDDFATEASLKAAIQAAMIAGIDVRIYLWHQFVAFEDNSEDAVYEETALSDLEVRPGKYRYRGFVRKNLCMHKAMFSHKANNGRAIIIDVNNKAFATRDASTDNIYGFSLNLLNVEKLKLSDGTVATKTPVYFVLADSNEIDQNGVMFPVPFINTLKRLTDVDLIQVGAGAVDEIVVSVTTSCDAIPVVGLLLADFIVTDASGDAVVVSVATDNGDGTYTLETVGAFDDGTIVTLRAAALLTVKAYEAVETALIAVA